MNVADRVIVRISAIVDDRDVTKTAAAAGQPPTAVRGADRRNVAHRATRFEIAVKIVTADLLVQVEKLVDRNRAPLQRCESVLNADVIEWPQRKMGYWVATEDVDRVVVDIAACAGSVGCRVVALRRRQHAGAKGRGGNPQRAVVNGRGRHRDAAEEADH